MSNLFRRRASLITWMWLLLLSLNVFLFQNALGGLLANLGSVQLNALILGNDHQVSASTETYFLNALEWNPSGPRRASVLRLLGVYAYHEGRPPVSIEYWMEATKLDAANPLVVYGVVPALAEMGRNDEALQILEMQTSGPLINAIALKLSSDKSAFSLRAIEIAETHGSSSDSQMARVNKMACRDYRAQGQLEMALRHCLLLMDELQTTGTYLELGKTYYDLGHIEVAREAFEKSIELGDTSAMPPAYY